MSNLRLAFVIDAVDRATATVTRVTRVVDRMASPVRRVHDAWRALGNDPRLVNALGNVMQKAQPFFAWGRTVVGALVGVAGAAGTAAFALDRIAGRVGGIADQAIKVGMTTEQFTRLTFAAKQAGASEEAMATGLVMLMDKLSEARTGGKEAVLWLSRIGVTAQDIKRGIGTLEVFDKLSDKFATVADTAVNSANKVAVMRNLMGRGGTELIQLANGGSAGLREAAARSDAIGATLNSKTAAGMKAYGDQVQQLKDALFGLATKVTGAALPAMTRLVEKLIAMTVSGGEKWANDMGVALGELIERVPDMIEGLAAIGGQLVDTLKFVDRLAQATGGWHVVLGALAVLVAGKVLIALYGLATAVWGVGAALAATPFGPVILGAAGLAAAATLVMAQWDPIKNYFKGLFEGAVKWINKIGDMLPSWMPRLPDVGPDGKLVPYGSAKATPSAVASAPAPSALPSRGAPFRQDIGGKLTIELLGDGKARVRDVQKAAGGLLDFDVYNGVAMVGQ